MLIKVAHETRYKFAAPTPYGLQQLRLTPKTRPGQNVVNWRIDIEGGRKEAEFLDQHENIVHLVSLEAGRDEIIVRSTGEVETNDLAGVIGDKPIMAPLWYYKSTTRLTEPGPGVQQIAKAAGGAYDSDVLRLHALSSLILERVQYQPGLTTSTSTAEDAITTGQGVCQDHAHIFAAAARLMGYPARYASGYLLMQDRVEQTAGHAWAEAYIERLGWVGFDVSNSISPDDRYVHVASGLDASEAAPVKGLIHGGATAEMSVNLQVQQ